jgi:hypothetical protein
MDKVQSYLAHLIWQVEDGHVIFFYENKQTNNLGREFVDAIGNGLNGNTSSGSTRLTWGGLSYQVGTNENVWIVFSKTCTTGPSSKQGSGLPFSIAVTAQHGLDGALQNAGLQALKTSMNNTIMSNLSMGKAEFRTPAIVHITITKPNGSIKVVRVAAWHAPGPAQGSAPLLNETYQRLLHGHVDIFLGDFNMTGLDTTPSRVPLPLTLRPTGGSTTLTANGPVPHQEGLDLVYMDSTRLGAGTVVNGNQIGNAYVCSLGKPNHLTYQEAYDLSDHLPILVTLKEL